MTNARRSHLANGVEARLQVAQVALRVGHAAALALDGRRDLAHARLQLLWALPQYKPKDQQDCSGQEEHALQFDCQWQSCPCPPCNFSGLCHRIQAETSAGTIGLLGDRVKCVLL